VSSDNTDVNELMRITGNGNVGVGTAAPNEKLEVNGKIRMTPLNGGGLTTANIDNNGNITWSFKAIKKEVDATKEN